VVAAWQVRALPSCIRCVTSTFLDLFVCCGWCASGTALPGATRVVARGTSTHGGQVCPRQTVSGATWGACGRWTPQGGECAATCGVWRRGMVGAFNVQVRGVLSPCERAWCQFTPPLLVLNVLNVRPGRALPGAVHVDVVGSAAEGGRASTSKHHPPSKRPRRQGPRRRRPTKSRRDNVGTPPTRCKAGRTGPRPMTRLAQAGGGLGADRSDQLPPP